MVEGKVWKQRAASARFEEFENYVRCGSAVQLKFSEWTQPCRPNTRRPKIIRSLTQVRFHFEARRRTVFVLGDQLIRSGIDCVDVRISLWERGLLKRPKVDPRWASKKQDKFVLVGGI